MNKKSNPIPKPPFEEKAMAIRPIVSLKPSQSADSTSPKNGGGKTPRRSCGSK